jgi:Zinc-binding domain
MWQFEEEQQLFEEQLKLDNLHMKVEKFIRKSGNLFIHIKDLPFSQEDKYSIISLIAFDEGRHFIVSKNGIRLKHLTPMQVSYRLFGKYNCTYCNKQWTSGYSWRNTWQKCKECEAKVYPFHQRKLESSKKEEEIEIIKPHDSFRCEKCRELGRSCVTLRKIGI